MKLSKEEQAWVKYISFERIATNGTIASKKRKNIIKYIKELLCKSLWWICGIPIIGGILALVLMSNATLLSAVKIAAILFLCLFTLFIIIYLCIARIEKSKAATEMLKVPESELIKINKEEERSLRETIINIRNHSPEEISSKDSEIINLYTQYDQYICKKAEHLISVPMLIIPLIFSYAKFSLATNTSNFSHTTRHSNQEISEPYSNSNTSNTLPSSDLDVTLGDKVITNYTSNNVSEENEQSLITKLTPEEAILIVAYLTNAKSFTIDALQMTSAAYGGFCNEDYTKFFECSEKDIDNSFLNKTRFKGYLSSLAKDKLIITNGDEVLFSKKSEQKALLILDGERNNTEKSQELEGMKSYVFAVYQMSLTHLSKRG